LVKARDSWKEFNRLYPNLTAVYAAASERGREAQNLLFKGKAAPTPLNFKT